MATIRDVARLAGVSPATVSRVFSGSGVSAAKVEAVRDAAARLSFRPNRAARALRLQSAEAIALIIPDIENPYFTELARGVEDVASEVGYSVVLCNTDGQETKQSAYLDIAMSAHMAGVILAAASAESDLDGYLATGRPIVAVDRKVKYDIDSVVMDNHNAGRTATAHLLRRHSRVAYIGGPEHIETSRDRANGWRRAHIDADLEFDPGLERFDTFRVAGGRSIMEELLSLPDPPDAVVAGNNLIGVGILQVLTERGLTPPSLGVAVVGSLPFTTLTPNAVTIVRLPAREMGVTAVRLLLERAKGSEEPARLVVLSHALRPSRPTGAGD